VSPSFFQTARYPASVGALVLGWFLFGAAQDVWNSYWLLKDGQQVRGFVTRDRGRNIVDYTYEVGGKQYKGRDRRRYFVEEHRYENAMVDGRIVVYFSPSHPWLSRLTPQVTIIPEGFPVLLLMLAFEVMFIITIINPDHKWAYRMPQRPAAS